MFDCSCNNRYGIRKYPKEQYFESNGTTLKTSDGQTVIADFAPPRSGKLTDHPTPPHPHGGWIRNPNGYYQSPEGPIYQYPSCNCSECK